MAFIIEFLFVLGKGGSVALGSAALIRVIFRRSRWPELNFRAGMLGVIEGNNPTANLWLLSIEVGQQACYFFRAHADCSCRIHCLRIAAACFSSSWTICSSLFCGACWTFLDTSCTRFGVSPGGSWAAALA